MKQWEFGEILLQIKYLAKPFEDLFDNLQKIFKGDNTYKNKQFSIGNPVHNTLVH